MTSRKDRSAPLPAGQTPEAEVGAAPDTAPETAVAASERLLPPTIRDVALKAGVSLGTASNVLNGKQVVSPERRDLVLKAAAEIGYRPNRLARGLRGQRTQLIGLCVTMISSAYHASLVEALDEIAFTSDRHLIQMLSHGDPARELAQIDTLLEHQVDGIILMPSARPERVLDRLASSGVPTVIVDRAHDRHSEFDLVLLDHAEAMRAAVMHLVDLGHRRLLFVVRHPNLVTTSDRIAVLEEIARESEVPLQYEVLALTDEAENLQAALAARLAVPSAPTAIIASNSINTLWTLRSLRQLGLRIPNDISLVAFDEPVWGELVDPPLTLIRQPVADIARSGWELLEQRIADPRGPRQRVLLPNSLVIRGSTQSLAAG